jgi:trans-2,3-dihydro-3-hydroxyanthranilate isomerase
LSDLPLGNLALRDPLEGVNVFAVAGDAARAVVLPVNARVFVPGLSVPEDPATGSAAAGLGIVLCALGLVSPDGETRYRITQGVDMGRPSVLHGRVEALAGQPVACRVAGQVVPVATGTIAVPRP